MQKLLLSAMVCAALSASAQSADHAAVKEKFISDILRQQRMQPLQRTNATEKLYRRGASAIGPNGSFSSTDSATYSYSGTNGSAFNLDELTYFDDFAPGNVSYYTAYPIRYDKIEVMFDSCRHYGNGSYKGLRMATFNSAGQVSSVRDFRDTTSYFDAYAAGKLSAVYRLTKTDTVGIYRSYYDGQGRRVADSIFGYSYVPSNQVYTYTYNASGLVDQMTYYVNYGQQTPSWGPAFRYTNRYYSNNKLRSVVYEVADANTRQFTKGTRDSFTYDLNAQFVKARYLDTFTAAGVANPLLIWDKHINILGLPDTLFQGLYNNGQYTNYLKKSVEYNTAKNPVIARTYRANGGYNLTNIDRYYYTPLYPSSVPSLATEQSAWSIYPNPASGELCIAAAGLNENVKVALYNTAGQLVLDRTVNAAAGKLDMSALTPGLYWISIRSGAGQLLHRASVIRQ